MTTGAAVALTVALLLAVADWGAVALDRRKAEYVAKPAALGALLVAALLVDPADPAVRAWFVLALVLSLAGDVFLMLPRDRFVAGLASFLGAHVAYIAGFLVAGVPLRLALAGALMVVPVTALVGRHILRAVRRAGDPGLVAPVAVYMLVISAMVITAFRDPVAAAGASLFYGSDALIAWNRFVQPVPWARVAIMVTYHAGQALLVLSLI